MTYNNQEIQNIQAARHLNSNGIPIAMHHAFRTIGFTKSTLLTMLLLPVFFDLLLWWQVDNIIALWHGIFSFWSQELGFVGAVENMPAGLLFSDVDLPLPPFDALVPAPETVYINGIAAALLFAVSFFLPERLMPVSYLLRACLIIHLSAVLYFLINPLSFPYSLIDHINGGLGLGLHILFIIPPILGLIYYIFDLGIFRKFLLTALMLGYFILFIPMQYFMHALILHNFSLIFMPLLYLMFGLLLDVLMCVSLYSYGMTWKKN